MVTNIGDQTIIKQKKPLKISDFYNGRVELAVFVHTARQSQTTIVGMDKHLNAIENVALGVVGVECLVASHLRVGVVALHHVVVDDDGEGAADDFPVHADDHLTFREDGYELLDLCLCPEHVLVAVDALERACELVVVIHLEIAQLYLVDVVRFHSYSEIILMGYWLMGILISLMGLISLRFFIGLISPMSLRFLL